MFDPNKLTEKQREDLYIKILRMKQQHIAVATIAIRLKVSIAFVKFVYSKAMVLYGHLGLK